jgi:outer membrane lipoprotein-sorting protein
MRKAIFLIVFSFVLATVTAGLASAQTADEIVEKHLAALGGRDALGKITSRRSTGTITIATPAGDLSGPCEIDAKAPNKTRAYMELDLTPLGVPQKMIVEQKFDGAAGWGLNSMQGDAEITGDQLQNMRNNTFPSSLLTYKAAGTRLEVLPAEKTGDRTLLVLQATPKAGPAIRMYFDAQTYMLVRTYAKYYSAALGADVEQTAELSDYRTVDGVKVPFHIVNANAQQTGTIVLTKVEHNVPFDDTLFVKR